MFNGAPGTKICCQCGKDLAAVPRKKDEHGRYWCIPCDENERKLKRMGFKEKVAASGADVADKTSEERARKIKMLSVLGAMAVTAAIFHFFVFN